MKAIQILPKGQERKNWDDHRGEEANVLFLTFDEINRTLEFDRIIHVSLLKWPLLSIVKNLTTDTSKFQFRNLGTWLEFEERTKIVKKKSWEMGYKGYLVFNYWRNRIRQKLNSIFLNITDRYVLFQRPFACLTGFVKSRLSDFFTPLTTHVSLLLMTDILIAAKSSQSINNIRILFFFLLIFHLNIYVCSQPTMRQTRRVKVTLRSNGFNIWSRFGDISSQVQLFSFKKSKV